MAESSGPACRRQVREPYGEAVATRAGPACPPKPWRRREPWWGVREDALQASAGARVGWVWSRESILTALSSTLPSALRPRLEERLRPYGSPSKGNPPSPRLRRTGPHSEIRNTGSGWIRTTEGIRRQIYSLIPLATRAHSQVVWKIRYDIRPGPSTPSRWGIAKCPAGPG